MPVYKKILPLMIFLAQLAASYGQADSILLYPVNNPILKEYNLRKMCVDKSGKLWFGTDKGVLSFDGNDEILFEKKEGDTTTLSQNSTGRLYPDKKGNLYVFGVRSEAYLDTKTGKVTPLDIRLREKDKSRMAFPYAYTEPFIDDDGSIWMGTFNIGFLHYDPKTKKTTQFPLYDEENSKIETVFSIKRDNNDKNMLWLATNDGIYSFSKNTRKLHQNFHSIPQRDSLASRLSIINMDQPRQDTIWFTVPSLGVGSYAVKSGRYAVYPLVNSQTGKTVNQDIVFFQRKSGHEYYVSAPDKLPGIFNTQTRQYSYASRTFEKLPAVQVRHIMADSTGNLWSLIFYQLYLAKNNSGKLTTFKLPADRSPNLVENAFKTAAWDSIKRCYYTVFDSRNEVFVLDTNKKLVARIPIETTYRNKNKKPVSSPQIGTGSGPQLASNTNLEPVIYDMGLDETGRLWLCGSSLWNYDAKSRKMMVTNLAPRLDFAALRFQNMVFRSGFMYLQPSHPSSHSIYRVNTKTLTCDSMQLPALVINDSIGKNQDGKKMDVLQVDKRSRFAYICNNSTVFQWNLQTGKARKILTLGEPEKPYQHFFNMFWYVLDDMDRLWIASLFEIKIYDPENLRLLKTIPMEKDAYPIQLSNITGKKIMALLYSGGLLLLDYENNEQFKLGLSDGLTTVFNSSVVCVNDALFIGAIDYLHYVSLGAIVKNRLPRRCYLSGIQIFNKPLKTDSLPEFLHALRLKHNQNFITLTFSSTEFDQPERLEYRYQLTGVDKDWVHANYLTRTISYNNLAPGDYIFRASVKNPDGKWSHNDVNLSISIIPAFWQTNWFTFLWIALLCAVIFLATRWRIKTISQKEQQKVLHQKELLDMEAKALRAQMNPHFIFNSLNSIKSLINKNENDKAAEYLTTFSKLIRTLFQNSDKREVSLFEELHTCQLYAQIEKLRFGPKVNFIFDIDEGIDLKDIKVPALVLQPFIENAIWHGLVPKESGGTVLVSVKQPDGHIECVIDDDGIGRELSQQYKALYESTHQSKGIGLTRSRLELDKLLNNREDVIKVIDKSDEQGKPSGTTVIITFKENGYDTSSDY